MRHYMNIDGAVRRLALFEPPIDPALLVRAAAAGIDMREGYDPELAGPRMVGHIRVDPDGSRVRCQEWSSSGDAGPSSRGGGTLQAGLLVGGLGASHAATATPWPSSSTRPVTPHPVDQYLPGAEPVGRPGHRPVPPWPAPELTGG